MKIGTIEARPGEKAYGFYKTGETHGRFPVHIPLHIVRGAADGPTLVVQAGASGLELEPALILPQIVKHLDTSALRGTLVVVPLMNTSGFEFEQINSAWDNKHLNSLGRGLEHGSVSEQMIWQYYQNVLAKADALLEIRTGSQWSYYRYAGVYNTGNVEGSTTLARALGLQQVVIGQPVDRSMAYEAAIDGKAVVTAYIGGGPGLRDFRDEDLGRMENAVLNALRHLGMMDGAIQYEEETQTIIDAHTFLYPVGERGFTFMHADKRGSRVKAGESVGYVRHPFTGQVVEEITAPRDGVLVHAGASWPVTLEGELLAMLGDVKTEITVR
jgi:uncharacterized protein